MMPELPNEIWLHVFEHLHYGQLKKCARVNKTFKVLTEHASLNHKMFRGKCLAVGAPVPVDTLQMHPIFGAISYACGPDIDDIMVLCEPKQVEARHYMRTTYGDDFTILLKDMPVADEHATNPPVPLVRLKFHVAPIVEVTNDFGVTVLQVMEAATFVFGRPHKWKMLYDISPWLLDENFRGNKPPNRLATYRETMMGDHTGWTGFHRKKLDSNGRLVLKAGNFDS